jgi:hypothetical protein
MSVSGGDGGGSMMIGRCGDVSGTLSDGLSVWVEWLSRLVSCGP